MILVCGSASDSCTSGRLPDFHQTVNYQEENGKTQDGRERSETEISEWFGSNKAHPTSRRLLSSEYEYFAWNRAGKKESKSRFQN